MPYEQVQTLLEKLRNIHNDLAGYYTKVESECRQERIKILMDFMKLHEEKMAANVEHFLKDAEKSTLSSYYSFTPDQKKWEIIKHLNIPPDSDIRVVIDRVLTIDETINELVCEIINNTELEHVRDTFENIRDEAKLLRKQFVRDIMMIDEC